MNETTNPYEPPVSSAWGTTHGEVELASRLSRLLAAIIDTLILMVFYVPVFLLTFDFEGMATRQVGWQGTVLQTLYGIGCWFAVNGYLLHRNGQTLGKRFLNIKIVRAGFERAGLGRIVGYRTLPFWLAGSIPFVGGIISIIDVLFIFGERRQCLHDLVADTKVIKSP